MHWMHRRAREMSRQLEEEAPWLFVIMVAATLALLAFTAWEFAEIILSIL